MIKYIVLLFVSFSCFGQKIPEFYTQIETTNEQERKEAYSHTKDAVLAVPKVRERVKHYTNQAGKKLGINEENGKYIPPVLVALQGRISSKYFKNLKYTNGDLKIVPLAEWYFKDGFYRIEVNLTYSFW